MNTAQKWSPLSPPVDALANTLAARAQSILFNTVDGSGLSMAEAQDVIAWHENHLRQHTPAQRRWISRIFRP
jgi:hypothetical protein